MYFSHINPKRRKIHCIRIQISFHILVADGRCAKLSTAGVYCAVHSQNLKNFVQSKFLCLSLLLNHTFSWQELNMIRVDVVQICGIWGKLRIQFKLNTALLSYCPCVPVFVRHRRDISHFSHI